MRLGEEKAKKRKEKLAWERMFVMMLEAAACLAVQVRNNIASGDGDASYWGLHNIEACRWCIWKGARPEFTAASR